MTRARHHNPRYASGSFQLSYHLEMISDRERVDRGKEAIRAAANDVGQAATFLELGCGTGVFSIFAAQFCKRVYAVESDPEVLAIAKQNISKHRLTKRIELIEGDALLIEPPTSSVDILFCEMMSIWLIAEPQVPVVRRWLKEYRHSLKHVIPRTVVNVAELGQIDYEFDGLEIRADLPQFSGVRPPRIMTESRAVKRIHLDQESSLEDGIKAECQFRTLVSGRINCARLTSLVEFFPGVPFFSTDTLMPVTIVPLRDDLTVEANSSVQFYTSYRHRSDLSDSSFAAHLVDGGQ